MCVCVCVCVFSCSVMTDSLKLHGHSSPGSSIHGIFQTRTLEQVAISYFRGCSRLRDQTHVFCVSCIGRRILYLCATSAGLNSPKFRSDQISCLVVSDSLRPHESQHARPPCPSPTPRVHSNSHPSSQWCHPAISSSVIPFSSCPQSIPTPESFPMSQLFA